MSELHQYTGIQVGVLDEGSSPVAKSTPNPGLAALARWRATHPAEAAASWARSGEALTAWLRRNPEVARNNADTSRARLEELCKTRPDLQPGPKRYNAVIFHLRDPRGRTYEFRNLRHFIREHKYLFDPLDLVPDAIGSSRALRGLYNLKAYNKHGTPKRRVAGSWKGWTYVGYTEGRNRQDLLDRQPASPEAAAADILVG